MAQILNLQIVASADDCRRRKQTSGFDVANAQFSAGNYDATYYGYGDGGRFLNVTIPKGATITTAYLTLTADESYNGTTVNTKISAEDVDNPSDFSGDDATSFDARYATHTTAIIDWNSIEAWALNTEYNKQW